MTGGLIYAVLACLGALFPIVLGGLPPGVPACSADPAASQRATSPPSMPPSILTYPIADRLGDGTEFQDTWYPDGYSSGLDFIGMDRDGRPLIAAFRFAVPDLAEGDKVAFARLRLASEEEKGPSPLSLIVRGLDEDSPEPCSQARLPSRLAKTAEAASWQIRPYRRHTPRFIYRTSPNLAPIVNEILARPGWGISGKALVLIAEPDSSRSGRGGHIAIQDYAPNDRRRSPAMIEIYPTFEDALVGKPLAGRPTDTSVTISVVSLLAIDAYLEYGETPANYTFRTEPQLDRPAERPIEMDLSGLRPDTQYFYRLRSRPAGGGDFLAGPEGSFHTQRPRGSDFTFTIQADAHMGTEVIDPKEARFKLYQRTIGNALADKPDFHIDLGDFARIEVAGRASATTSNDAFERYLSLRRLLAPLGEEAAFYFVLGNHEAEQGWRHRITDDSLATWGILARKQIFPNPYPNAFYSGNTDTAGCCGLREDYYAWEWGDALFVVLDPFWYTGTRPHNVGGQSEPSLDAWDWTLGERQYNWLYETLHQSSAKWKFVFVHHLTGGVSGREKPEGPYGRGGIDGAQYRVAHRPTFEWGGEDSTGKYVFETERPGWTHGPIHRMMVEEGVDVCFHGHDHVFVYESLDGIVYQACPNPADYHYSRGYFDPVLYSTGIEVNNAGHLRVVVATDSVRVDYVRSVLPEDEPLKERSGNIRNGDVSYSYTLRK
ncbi:MAG: metallophosphoesterase [Candidatus Eisenbacteria bacterium]